MITSVGSVACPGCGCVCDDLTLTVEDGRLSGIAAACPLGREWFETRAIPGGAAASIDGIPAAFDDAVARAADLLASANLPLVYGLSRSATDGQRAAVALAERFGAVIDTTASVCHGPSIMAMQEVGESTCSLGEVRNRADLVIFWGCNPAASHPRHAERYSVDPRGRFTPSGRADRTVVMIGDARHVHEWRLDQQGSRPDIVLEVKPGRDFEMISMLRWLLHGGEPPTAPQPWRELVRRMRECRYGIVFFGLDLVGTGMGGRPGGADAGRMNVAALLQLVSELNAFTRFTARRMRVPGDVSGADAVLCWQTGFPFAVDLSRGYPRFNPGEFTANELLERGDIDLCVIVGAETVPFLSPRAQDRLRTTPTILLDYPGTALPYTPAVSFTTAVYGLHVTGTIYRMDNIPLPLRAALPTELPTDEAVLTGILSRA